MLQSMRSAISSWAVKLLLAALVFSFISFYGWRGDQGLTPGVAASVDGETISTRDLYNRTEGMIQVYRNMGVLKEGVSEEMLRSIQSGVLSAMIGQKIKIKEAKKLGLVASDEQVKETIRKQFSDATHPFDFELYKNILRSRLGKTPGAFEQDEADAQLSAAYEQTLGRTAAVSTQDLRAMYELRNEKVSLSYVRIDPKKAAVRTPPSENELNAFYETRKAAYQTPEARQLDLLWCDLGDFIQPDPKELNDLLKQKFAGEKDDQAAGPRIRAAHILIRTAGRDEASARKQAEKIHKQLLGGADFARIAQAESEDPSRSDGGDLGYFGKGRMVKEFETAAFTLNVGQVSPPVKSPFGFHLIKLMDKIPAGPKTAARLDRELRYEWRKETAKLSARREKFEKEASALLKGYAAAAKKDPRIRHAKTGFASTGDAIAGLPDGRDASEILRTVQTLPEGAMSEPIKAPASGNVYLARVLSVRPSKTPALAEVRAKVAAEYADLRAREALAEFSKTTLKKWTEAGKPIDVSAKAAGFPVMETGDFARSADNRVPKLGVSEPVMATAFTRPADKPFFPEPVTVGGETYLIAVKKRTEPDWKEFDAKKTDLLRAAEDEAGRNRLQTWTAFFRSKAKIKQSAQAVSTD